MFKRFIFAFVSLLLVGPISAQSNKLECIAPANPGGGWDFTCRQVGKTMQDLKLVSGTVQVTNLAGGGGGVAFANVVNKRKDDNNLIIAASSATATRLAQGAYPGNTKDQVRWLASVGADYGVIAVSDKSDIKDLNDFLTRLKSNPNSLPIGGGSAVGGWDHLKVLITAKKFGIDDIRKIKYVNFDGGADAITQLLGGSVKGFTGDVSEAKGFIESGDIRVIAVLAPQRLEGEFAHMPTAKEQGVDVVGANWRGFYGPGDMSDSAYNLWVDAIEKVYASKEWKKIMKANGLAPLSLSGKEFENFVSDSIDEITGLSKQIGIIK